MATNEIDQLKAAMAALEAQRPALGDAMVEILLGPMRDKLALLEARPRAEQQRKQATVLFADVSGFTAISETMDAEDVAGIMNDLWVRVDRAIIDGGGHIDKHIGDAVMALWGAGRAREDDPERAVRAALAMQEAIRFFCQTHDVPMAIRIGINTGPVILGAMGTTGEFTAMGDAVNMASRLERAAPVGGILISHDTYRHIRGIFSVTPQAPLAVKGRTQPVQTYVVKQAKPRAFRMATRGVEGVETRMVGRDAELDTLRNAHLDAFEAAETRAVTIVGEAGVGKSRLLYEFGNWIELRPERIFFFKGRSTPNLQNVPYSLFRDLFINRFEILESDTVAVALDKFRRGMDGILEPDLADVVGHWLGFDFSSSEAVQNLLGGSGLMETARAFLMRYFRAMTGDRPTAIFLEDIHWADDQSLDLASYLATAIPEAPLLIVAVARPSLFERRPDWGAGQMSFTRVTVRPLSKRTSRALVDEILQRVDSIPEALHDLITDAAEGNPFYVEEMVKMLIEQGVIEREEAWRVRTDRLANLKVPATLTALLQARLDGLPAAEREVLQRAAVVGRLFWDDAVAELLETKREVVVPTLESVRNRELIFRREHSAFAGAEEYIFKHALLRDVAYEMVLLKRRAIYHGRAARWLENHAGERLGEYLTVIAEHYIHAGESLRAAILLEQAGHEAREIGNYAAARHTLERALELREATNERGGAADASALVGLGRVCISLNDYPAAEAALERGLAAARAAGDSAAEVEALGYLAAVAMRRGDYTHAWALAEKALPLGRALGGRLATLAELRAATVLENKGEVDAAESHAIEAVTLSRAAGNVMLEANALFVLATIAKDRRDLEQADAFLLMSYEMARQSNNLYAEANTLLSLGDHAYRRGDYVMARVHGSAARERLRELGAVIFEAIAAGNVAQAELKLGDAAAARRGAREVLLVARSLSSLSDILWTLYLFGQILAETGEFERALRLYGLARAHPALPHEVRVELDEDIIRLGLPPEQVETGLAAGAALVLDTVVEEILADAW